MPEEATVSEKQKRSVIMTRELIDRVKRESERDRREFSAEACALIEEALDARDARAGIPARQ